jgi:tetratricopeptide (TPR) repeat protein
LTLPRSTWSRGLVAVYLLASGWVAPCRAADDLDDLDLDGPAVTASASPAAAPAPAASPRPAAAAPGDELGLPGDELDLPGTAPEVTPATGVASGPATLPGGLKDAWNLVAALSIIREAKQDSSPELLPFKPWQGLRFAQELDGILRGCAPSESPKVQAFLKARAAVLLDRGGGDGAVQGVEVDRLSRRLVALERPGSAVAREVARGLARIAGDESAAESLVAMAVHGADFTGYRERAYRLLFGPAGASWVLRNLGGSDAAAVDAAVGYLTDAATRAETTDVLGSLASVPAPADARAVSAAGVLGTPELLPALEAAAAGARGGALARASGESIGRIRQRAEALESHRSGPFGELERRESAARLNAQGLAFYRADRHREALAKFRMAEALDASEPTYAYNAGSALYRLGNVAEGSELILAAIQRGGDDLRFYRMATTTLRDLGQRGRLVEFLEKHADRARYSGIVTILQLNLAAEYVASGEAEKALSAVDLAFARAVPDALVPSLLARRGDALMLGGDPARARRAYEKALELAPEHKRAQDGLLRVEASSESAALAAGAQGGAVGAAGGGDPTGSGPDGPAGGLRPPSGIDRSDALDVDSLLDADRAPAPAAGARPSPQASPGARPPPQPGAPDDLDLEL